jgi:hypothetical protein
VKCFARRKFHILHKIAGHVFKACYAALGMTLCEQPDNKHFLVMRISFDYRQFNPEREEGEKHGS